ncbi:hypothetical protein G9A89_003088 [Geosiphon pyriformis]|nr:hypothetical protein G9A89_003088 [Geosiphon pyriformis]
MESFKINKNHIIRSVLECFFHKVVLDHLVVNDKLILEPNLVKFKVDVIIKGWTRKCSVIADVPDEWSCQYQSLDYVFDKAFSDVMGLVEFSKLSNMVSNLLNSKAAGLLNIANKLWKHCDKLILDMLLVLLNFCLFCVLMNTYSIALIKTAHKILSKIFSNKIFLACSTFNVFRGDNFSVLKGTMTQSPIFAEHLEKSLVRIKMYGKFIQFFGSIYRDCTNWMMTDFGLTDSYCVYDGLDQRECIFYNPLLCKVKCWKSMYEYKLNSYFIFKCGHAKSQAGLSSFFIAGTFTATQHILNIAGEFFWINDIFINNNKMVAIFINSIVSNPSLSINGLPISIAKKNESYWYLGIFLLTENFSKPSLAKVNSNVCFFTNLVLRKTVLDKQLLYLVLAVLYSIVSYRTQFSFIFVDMCNKWDALIHKSLKLKSGLPHNFSSDTIHHPLFYGLKSFVQVQFKSKIAFLVSFVNFSGILGHLFSYKSHNLQVLCWYSVYPLSFFVHIHVSASDNFLAGMIKVFLDCNLSLEGSLANPFQFHSGVPMSAILGELRFFRFLPFLQRHGIAFFKLSVAFLGGLDSSSTHSLVLGNIGSLKVLESSDFKSVCIHLSQAETSSLLVYMNGFFCNLGTANCKTGAAVFFEDINLGLDIGVLGLMSSTLVKLQAIALALECVPTSSSVYLFSDIKHHHIVNVICNKDLRVSWHKVKSYSGVSENKHINAIAGTTSFTNWYLLFCLSKHFIMANDGVVSGNSKHFVHDIYHSVCHAYWKIDSGSKFLAGSLISEINWLHSSLVWHLDLYMVSSFTSRLSANITGLEIVKFVSSLGLAFRENIWSVCVKYQAYMKKNGLIPLDGLNLIPVYGLALRFSAGIVKLLGITEAFGIWFGFYKSCLFFSSIDNQVLVHIVA